MDNAPNPQVLPPRESKATRWALVVVAIVAAVALFYPRSDAGTVSVGGFLVDGEGRPVPVTDQLSGATLVHFWATWCPPCRTELPELVRFARETRGGGPRVLFVAVGDEVSAATRFLAADDQTLLFDPAWEVTRRFGTSKLPETHLVVNGKIVQSFIGATAWSDTEVRRQVQKWTATPTSAAP